MVQPGLGRGVLDTPQTNVGDVTQRPDFADISQEASFHSPPNEGGNFLQQLRNGRSKGIDLRTPRQRDPLTDRRNLPQSIGGGEFTPLLKSATRNSIRRGKENGTTSLNTPGLNRIDEDDMSPLPGMNTSLFTGSRNQSYLDQTLPQVESSSAANTPLAMHVRRDGDKGPLEDGNGLSLREQENVIDRIEKENFSLKLKIHFLEDALHKAGPGYSEAALKENTELKVSKVTLEREVHKCKKYITTVERDLESCRQQMADLQEKARHKSVDDTQRAEMDQLRQTLEAREEQIRSLEAQIDNNQGSQDDVEKLRDEITDLEADVREKGRIITEREDELEDLKDKLKDGTGSQDEVDKLQEEIDDLEATVRDKERLIEEKDAELEEKDAELEEFKGKVGNDRKFKDQVDKLQDDIADLEVDLREKDRLLDEKDDELEGLKDKLKDAGAHDDEIEQLRQEMAEIQEELDDRNRVLAAKEEEVQDLRTRLIEDDKADILEKLEFEIADLKADLRDKDVVIGQKDQQLDGLEVRLEDADQRISELSQLRDQILEDVRAKLDDAERKIQRLEARGSDEVVALREKLEEAERRSRDAKKLENGMADLQMDLRDKERLISSKEDEVKGLRAKLNAEDKSKVFEKLQEEISDMEVNLRDRDRALREKERLLRSRDEEIDDLKNQMGESERKVRNLQRQIRETAEAAGEDDKSAARIQELEKKLEARTNDFKTLEKELQQRTDEKNQLQQDLQARSDELALLEQDLRPRSQDKRQLEEELQERTDEKELLEELLDDAKQQADEAETEYNNALQRLKLKVEMLERERERTLGSGMEEQLRQSQAEIDELEQYIMEQQDTIDALLASESALRQQLEEVRNSGTSYPQDEVENLEHDIRQQQETINRLVASERSLRQKLERARQGERGAHYQSEVKNLEHDVRQQQETIDALVNAESALRQKLEQARSERTAYRKMTEKLQRDINRARKSESQAMSKWNATSNEALDTVVRAAESAEERHKKELRGLVTQMDWMQARWRREASLRNDAAYAKRFLQLQLDVANACNKAQLRDLEHIRTKLLGNNRALILPSSAAKQQQNTRPTLKSFLSMARFIARMRISARDWAEQEKVRQKLVTATEERRRSKAKKHLKVVRVGENV